MRNWQETRMFICAFGALAVVFSPVSYSDNKLESLLKQQSASQSQAIEAQKKIDTLHDQSQAMADEYRTLIEQTDDLAIYNAQLERLIQSQKAEIAQYDADLTDLERTRRRLMPLMWQMTEALEQIRQVDTPFLANERKLRVEELFTLMDRADITVADKYRRIMESYQVEAEYGHTIEAYQGDLEWQGEKRTVDFLRFGRIGLYFISLDGKSIGMWDKNQSEWMALDNSFLEQLAQGIRIARKQMPPDLIRLPIQAPISAMAAAQNATKNRDHYSDKSNTDTNISKTNNSDKSKNEGVSNE